MLIYLDTRDIINFFEKGSSEDIEDLKNLLINKTAKLVFSNSSIFEYCAPLCKPKTRTNITRVLNCLERMPHTYISLFKIRRLELEEAVNAFLKNREYIAINPFVNRFDHTAYSFQPPITKYYLSYSLSQIVFELWTDDPSIFKKSPKAAKLKSLMLSDRKLSNPKNHKNNFKETIRRDLALYKVQFQEDKVEEISDWIWQNPNRCPALRLGYELYHKILKNLRDLLELSDIEDFSHVSCLPYVNAITLDRRIRGYIKQVDHNLSKDNSSKVFSSLQEIIDLMKRTT